MILLILILNRFHSYICGNCFMKFIKLLLISVVAFFLIVTVFSLFIPSHIIISRATNIAPGSNYVLERICDLNEWKTWHPQLKNVILKDTISSGGRIVNATANGTRLSVLKCSDDSVTVQMQKREEPVNNHWVLIRHGSDDSLTLQNYIEFDFGWLPWEKFSSLMLEGSYGPVMEQGLANLKE